MFALLVRAARLKREDAIMTNSDLPTSPRTEPRTGSLKKWLMLAILAGLAASAGFWIAAVSFQFKLKPYFYAIKVINKVSSFDPDKDFVYRTMSKLYITQPYTRKVTFLGDSIVAFGKWDVLLKNDDIDNHGIPGDTTQGLLLRLRRHEVVGGTAIVMLGVNDLKMELSQDQTLSNIRDIVKTLRGRRVILVSTLLTAIPSTNAKLATIIAFEKSVCEGGGCTYRDVNRILAPNGTLEGKYTTDGVHLNWLGYQAISSDLGALVTAPSGASSASRID